MGRVAVRQAVAAYFQTASLPYVGTVFTSRPTVINATDYSTNMFNQVVTSENGSACVIVVNIPGDSRERFADTGRGAVNDWYKHTVALELFFGSTRGEAIAAQDDYDLVIDSIVTAIRTDATLGNPAVIWSAGEYSPWIVHRQGAPYTGPNGLTTFIPGELEFSAWEDIAGPVSSL